MRKSITYHTRLDGSSGVKLVGGSFGGDIDMETVERLVKAHFSVKVTPSGRPVFVDSQGRDVSLYLHIDADRTSKGQLALQAYRVEQAARASEESAREEQEEAEIEAAMEGLSHAEIMRRLRPLQ